MDWESPLKWSEENNAPGNGVKCRELNSFQSHNAASSAGMSHRALSRPPHKATGFLCSSQEWKRLPWLVYPVHFQLWLPLAVNLLLSHGCLPPWLCGAVAGLVYARPCPCPQSPQTELGPLSRLTGPWGHQSPCGPGQRAG